MKEILKTVSLFGLTLCSAGMMWAQKIDAKSQTILDAVTSNYKSKSNTYFKFTYGTGSGSVSKTETGIFYANGIKYKLKIMGIEQIFDGKKIYNINAADKEITVAKPNDNETMFSPLSYLETYKKDFNVDYTGKKKIGTKNLDQITMIPVKDNGLKKVDLYIDTLAKKIVKLDQLSVSNQVAIITIVDYKENQTLSPSLFTFDKSQFPKYLITEL